MRSKSVSSPEQGDTRLKALERFKEYWDSLYGTGLEVVNWHQNGNHEAFDNFYEEALKLSELN